MMKRFRHMQGPSVRDVVGNKWAEESMRTYLHECRQKFFRAIQQVYSLSWDGTRLSGWEHIFGTFYAPSARLACWSPPMVPRSGH